MRIIIIALLCLLMTSVNIDAQTASDIKKEYFRTYNKEKYRILNQSSICLYSREKYVVRGKEKTREKQFYFSKDAQSPLHPLTLHNLKTVYPSRDFHDMLDLQFRADNELLMFDRFHGEYKLTRLIDKTARADE